MTAPAHYAGPIAPAAASQHQAERPAHAAFGDIAADYAGRVGHLGNSENARLARAAASDIAAASAATAHAVSSAASLAADRGIAPEGRRDLIDQLGEATARDAGEKLNAAEAKLTVARAGFEVDALRKVSRSEENSARQDAMMLLGSVPTGQLHTRMAELVQRDDAVGALIASQWGSDYMASRGADMAAHAVVRQAALQAAAQSGDPERERAAQALGQLEHYNGAILAARRQVAHATGTDIKFIRATVTNPLAAENARLNRIIDSQRHQLKDQS